MCGAALSAVSVAPGQAVASTTSTFGQICIPCSYPPIVAPNQVDFTWNQGDPPLTLEPANSFVCGLTAVRGRFAGWGEWVLVDVDGNGNWTLSGSSYQTGVSARASCVNTSAFRTSGGLQYSWGSWSQDFTSYTTSNTCYANVPPPDDFAEPMDIGDGSVPPDAPDPPDVADISGNGGPIPYYCRDYEQDAQTGWGTDSVCYLSGFGGYHLSDPYNQNAEGATATMSPAFYGDVNPKWILDTFAWDLGRDSIGGAACVQFQNLPQTAANSQSSAYPNIGTIYSTVGMPVVYVAGTNYSVYQQPRLANRNDAFCVLSDVFGTFLSGNESVSIDRLDAQGRQQLTVAAGPNIGPTAYATCIYYDQVTPPNPSIEPFQ
jgi:hypothetical protein